MPRLLRPCALVAIGTALLIYAANAMRYKAEDEDCSEKRRLSSDSAVHIKCASLAERRQSAFRDSVPSKKKQGGRKRRLTRKRRKDRGSATHPSTSSSRKKASSRKQRSSRRRRTNNSSEAREHGEDAVDSAEGSSRGLHPIFWTAGFLQQAVDMKQGEGEWELAWKPQSNDYRFTKIMLRLMPKFTLEWDEATQTARNEPGVEVRPHGGVKSFMAAGIFIGAPLRKIIARLETFGYKEGESLVGHAYDWRLGVKGWQSTTYPLLKGDIEKAFEDASHRRIVLSSVSLGGLYFHAFLRWAGRPWVKKHIEAFVPFGGPWSGSTQNLQLVLSGPVSGQNLPSVCPPCRPRSDNFTSSPFENLAGGATMLAEASLKKVMRSLPTVYQLMPSMDHSKTPPEDRIVAAFPKGMPATACIGVASAQWTFAGCGAGKTLCGHWLKLGLLGTQQCARCFFPELKGENCPNDYEWGGQFRNLCCQKHNCITTPRSFRASELPTLFRFLGYPDSASMLELAHEQKMSKDPGVPVHCVVEHNLKTPTVVNLGADLAVGGVSLGDGDEVVERGSLEVCARWKSTKKVYRVQGVRHASSFKFLEEGLDILIAVATNNTEQWMAWKTPVYTEDREGFSPLSSLLVQPQERVKRSP